MKVSEAIWIAIAWAASEVGPISPIRNTAPLKIDTSKTSVAADRQAERARRPGSAASRPARSARTDGSGETAGRARPRRPARRTSGWSTLSGRQPGARQAEPRHAEIAEHQHQLNSALAASAEDDAQHRPGGTLHRRDEGAQDEIAEERQHMPIAAAQIGARLRGQPRLLAEAQQDRPRRATARPRSERRCTMPPTGPGARCGARRGRRMAVAAELSVAISGEVALISADAEDQRSKK